ncbi:MAG: hypothetical protein DRI28_04670, partial [Caldiserica bacterium]
MNKDMLLIQRRLIEWYQNHGRDFPWRHTKDPYRIMIAEFMLHRTRAEQVVPVYLEFIKKYPDVHSLALANPENIKKVTEHLGLHWRGRHFTAAAGYIVEKLKGQFPDDCNELRKIPGVGEYIAGAILTVCFDNPVPVVDSNIARFINRFWNLGLRGEIRRKKQVVKIAGELFNINNPGKFLFAIVDFTTFICKPRKPECFQCSLKTLCKKNYGPSPNSGYVVHLRSPKCSTTPRTSHTRKTLD